jgi:hypothetical protein
MTKQFASAEFSGYQQRSISQMAGYIYLPVPTQEFFEHAKKWTNGLLEKGKVPHKLLYNYEQGWRKGFTRRIGLGVLRNVANTDKLYIICHGAGQGSRKIGGERGGTFDGREWSGGVMKAYTAEQLAKVIESEGLAKSFIDLRVFACGSGLVPPVEGETRSFAEKLKISLVRLGYSRIEVTGYLGSIYANYSNRRLGMVDYTPDIHKGVIVNGVVWPTSSKKVVF